MNTQSPQTKLASPEPPDRTRSSRLRFLSYRNKVRLRQLPGGSVHSVGAPRAAKDRVRSSWQLTLEFLRLLKPSRGPLALALFTVTVSTLLGLLPPAGTKFVVDYVLDGRPLPEWFRRLSSIRTPLALLTLVVVSVTTISIIRIAIHLWGRWHATRISKSIQLSVRRRVFEHAVRLPLHRVQELRSGGVASILREDGGSVGELVFGMLYNPWRAVIQLLGSFAVLAWVFCPPSSSLTAPGSTVFARNSVRFASSESRLMPVQRNRLPACELSGRSVASVEKLCSLRKKTT
jgi:ATP-binding cassette subfamily B protein/subfamily B ATP-binding cassette protein MsbA